MQYVSLTQTKKHVTKIWHSVEEKFNHAHKLKAKLTADFEDELIWNVDIWTKVQNRGLKMIKIWKLCIDT